LLLQTDAKNAQLSAAEDEAPRRREMPPPAGPSVDEKTFTQENQKIERKQQEWLQWKGVD
jgi:hypothetical protein